MTRSKINSESKNIRSMAVWSRKHFSCENKPHSRTLLRYLQLCRFGIQFILQRCRYRLFSEKLIKVPFVVSFCLFLKEIVWAFLPVESKTNILYVNIKFTGSLFFGFGRYCGKVNPEPAVSQSFWAPAFTKKCSFNIFFKQKGLCVFVMLHWFWNN